MTDRPGLAQIAAASLPLTLLAASPTLPAPAYAQSFPCGKTADIEQSLRSVGERIAFEGATAGGSVLQLWVNPATRTFTVVVRMSNGRTCMLAAGDGMERPPAGDPL